MHGGGPQACARCGGVEAGRELVGWLEVAGTALTVREAGALGSVSRAPAAISIGRSTAKNTSL